ncbi:MAG: protease modulator HflC [Alphaproteobacteria bacterium]|nr:protease modulator HflC [Alphaproteobacteria bacterium]
MRNSLGLLGVLAAVLIIVAFNTFFVVEQREQALITQFGEPRMPVVQEPGLAWKVPFIQTVTFFDKRILELDAPPEEVIASDRRRIVVDAFARYRIVNPLRYYQSVRTDAVARQRLSSILSSSLRGELGKKSFAALLSSERSQLMQAIRDQIKAQSLGLGIEIVDVRIRRADLPKENLEAVFGRMQTERQREAAGIRASGDEESTRIKSTADKDVTIIKANATRKSEILRGEGDAEKNRVLGDAYGQDREFFEFYRTLKAYEASMTGANTTMVISPDSPFFKYFQRGHTGTR